MSIIYVTNNKITTMDWLDHGEFTDDLESKRVDVVAVAISSWHVLGVEAFLYDLSNKLERKVEGLILILPHEEEGYLIDETDFSNDFANLKFDFGDPIPDNQKFIGERVPNFISKYNKMVSGLRKVKSTGVNELYLLSPYVPYIELLLYFDNDIINTKYNPTFIIIDEGYGTYISKKTLKFAVRKDYALLDFISSKIFRTVDHVFRTMVYRNMKIEEKFLFKMQSPLIVNKDISESYTAVLKQRHNDLKLPDMENNVLVVTQPLSELKLVSEDEEMKITRSLIKFLNKRAIKPVFKLHPRESIRKYDGLTGCDFEILEGRYPVEEIIPILKPTCVIGFTSTAILNSKIFYGVTAVSLSDILSRANKEICTAGREFKDLTCNYINFVERIEELDKFI